jgi:hypothetical protein
MVAARRRTHFAAEAGSLEKVKETRVLAEPEAWRSHVCARATAIHA